MEKEYDAEGEKRQNRAVSRTQKEINKIIERDFRKRERGK